MLVQYVDLLGVPWLLDGADPESGLDCAGVAAIIWERCGLMHDPGIFHARKRFDFGDLRIENYFETMAQHFERIGDGYRAANQVGDLILSAPENERFVTHVSVIVDARQSLALTSAKKVGVHAVKSYAIRNITGVYRKVGHRG